MQTAAETGFPGALLLLMLFTGPAIKLWPLAHRLPTDDNRGDVMGGRAVVMAMSGFIVAGQFVTLSGLEIPYYMAMISVMILKDTPVAANTGKTAKPAVVHKSTSPRPGLAFGTPPVRSNRPIGVPIDPRHRRRGSAGQSNDEARLLRIPASPNESAACGSSTSQAKCSTIH